MDTTGNNSAQAPTAGTYLFPTTFAQQRLWFLEQLQPGSTSYLIPWSLRINGNLNAEALERSLNEIVRRHEVLRTTFSWKDGSPVQVVAGELVVPMAVLDLSSSPTREEEAQRLAFEEARRPLDLERGPLVRAQLLRLGPEDHILLLTMHHIIFDGWSRRILVRELAALYGAFGAGQPSPLPEPKLQYADYAVWQRKQFQGANLEKQLWYWRQQLAGAPASLDLPTDRPRPAVQSFNGAKLPLSFSKELSEGLQTFSRERGVTMFMTLLAGFQILLSRYSNQDDVVVGTSIANRNRAEIEEMIGFFTNTLVFRTRLSGQSTFAEVLAQVKETALGAYAHQDVPFEKLVEELQPERNLGQNPLFQVMFSYQNAPRRAFELRGLKLSLMDTREATSKFDLSLFLSETSEGVGGRVEYNTDLFDATTMQRLIGHFLVLLETAIRAPGQEISRLPLLTEKERTQIVVDWNATGTALPSGSIHELLEAQALRSPNAVAVVHGERELTYRELNVRANQVAHYLRALGVQGGENVATLLDRSIDLVVAELAILKCGAAYVPIDPTFPRERKAFIITDSQAKAVLSNESMELPESLAAPTVNIETALKTGEIGDLPARLDSEEAIAYIMYTSGSTGEPKGVMIPHRAIKRLVLNNGYAKFEASDRVAFASNPAFDAATMEVWAPLLSGGSLVVIDQSILLAPRSFGRALQEHGITTLWLTVGLFNEYADALSQEFAGLRYLITGGDVLDPQVVARVLHRNPPQHLINGYGPTETTTFAATHEITTVPENARRIPIGRPIANTRIYILDQHHQPVPVGITGELYVGGAGVACGYLKRPELTRERFIEDPFATRVGEQMYKTGDLGRWLPDGTIDFLGRNDFQVKLRGFRIELGEIEAALEKHPSVRQCLVIAREDEPGMKRLVAYVVAAAGEKLESEKLRQHLKGSLPEFMVPAAYVALDSFPLTPNGKADRKALPKPEFQAAVTSVPPRDELESKLQKIWRQILQTGPMGVTDNFFDLGGHSLMAVRLVDEIRKLTGIEVPLRALFQGATIEHLANIVRGTATVSRAVANQIQAGGDRPPFFAAVLAGINALGYVPLAKHLGPNQPFYTLQSPGPGPRSVGRPYTRAEYEEVSAEYVRAMRAVQPEGPYYLGGTCEGARIAFEITRILESQGQSVNLLAVIDTWVIENTQNQTLWKINYYFDRLQHWWQQPGHAKAAMARKVVRNRLQRWLGPKAAPRKSEWINAYWPGNDFAPTPVRSRIAVFKIPKQPFYYYADPLMGWGSRTTSGVETHVIHDGKHRLLLREPHVRVLAAALAKVLERLHSKDGDTLQGENQTAPVEVAAGR